MTTLPTSEAPTRRSRWIDWLLRRWPWPPVVAWLALSFGLSHTPGDAYPKFDSAWPSYVVHLGLYAGLGGLLVRALRAQFASARVMTLCAIAWVAGLLWGLSDEYHQEYFVEHRGWENIDLVMDGAGLVLGIAAFLWLRARLKKW